MSRFYRAAWYFYLFLALAGLAGLAAERRPIDFDLFVNRASWWLDLALGVATGTLLLLLWALVRRLAPAARELEATLAHLLGAIGREERLALAVVSAIGEEVFFRGAIQGWLGLLPAAALFALLHVGPGKAFRLWTLFALAGGLAFGGLVAVRGALGAAIVAHLVVNAAQLARLARIEVERAVREREPSAD